MSQEAMNLFNLGAGLTLFIIFMGILWWLLCIILFFKVWGMTNNVSRIKDMLEEWLNLEHPIVNEENEKAPSDETETKSHFQ